jgi:hypothetical protein
MNRRNPLATLVVVPYARLQVPHKPFPERIRWAHVAQTLVPWMAAIGCWAVLVFA